MKRSRFSEEQIIAITVDYGDSAPNSITITVTDYGDSALN